MIVSRTNFCQVACGVAIERIAAGACVIERIAASGTCVIEKMIAGVVLVERIAIAGMDDVRAGIAIVIHSIKQ